ncbi:MAG: hypothetical protein JEZ11_18665 [Desulfobacterales bacterium]|nr:hypothetical protein [Desulfobacterales bacterium]
MPANTLEDIYPFFHGQSMRPDEFESLYVDADRGRGVPIFQRLNRRLVLMPEGSQKMLFAGHRGCGKSTELLRLKRELDSDFSVLHFSILNELDPQNLSYIELFIATMEQLFLFFQRESGVHLPDRYFSIIQTWMTSREIQEINQDYMSMDVETGLKAGLNIPFLAEFFAKFRAAAKSSTSLKEVLRSKVEPKLSDLILNCNLLIDYIRSQLPRIGKKGLVIIIEDLDKVEMKRAEDIFYAHSAQLTQLACPIVFTFPIALLYHPRFKAIENNYEQVLVLPMVMVRQRNGDPFPDGMEVMEQVIAHRMDLGLFEDRSILQEMIVMTGGHFWDLFRMVTESSDHALDSGRQRIGRADYLAAYNALKANYERTLSENIEKGFSVDTYLETLVSCARDPQKKPKVSEVMLDLMNNQAVLHYDGENWHDVHPLVKDILKDRGLLENG